MATELRTRRADDGDLAYVERLLREHDLPHEDVRDSDGTFIVAEQDAVRGAEGATDEGGEGGRVGVAGLEFHGDAALLRSLVVEPSARGEGYGRALVRDLLAQARAADVEAVYLLTTTAAAFFADLGFERTDREAAPDAVRSSSEFAELCPASATCMRRVLSGE